MNSEESKQFWSEIDAQARQDYKKCVESAEKHRIGQCENNGCYNWLVNYWRRNYPKLQITKSGDVYFGDEVKYYQKSK